MRPEAYAGDTNSAYVKTLFHTANKNYQREDFVAFLCQAAPAPQAP